MLLIMFRFLLIPHIVRSIFNFRYGDYRLINFNELQGRIPVTMEDMLESVKISSQSGAEIFAQEWLPECSDIIDKHRDLVERWMPEEDPVQKEVYS